MLKVITGLNNFDQKLVTKVARSASVGGADLLDVACAPNLVKAAIESSALPICVSSVEPESFPAAINAGASMIEIGNFDTFYPKGRFFDADEVLSLAIESRKLLPNVVLSVTVPHILPLDKQGKLALDLIEVGADLIQTEGGTSSHPIKSGVLGLIEKAAPTLAAAHSITKSFEEVACKAPVLCASGLSDVTVPMALASGASGVGIGSAINGLDNELEMIAMVRTLRHAIESSKCLLSDSIL
ncbi:IMP dehydrogenase/GMP reductase [Prochlorococcus sp. SS52]|nr:IMP dehydrogenase/GMP reductase [Prochlorococcus sp. SS52]